MATDRPDWDGSGGNGALPTEQGNQIARPDWGDGERLTLEIEMPSDGLPPRTTPRRLPRDDRGRIQRPDWDQPPAEQQAAEPSTDLVDAPAEAYAENSFAIVDYADVPAELHPALDIIGSVAVETDGFDGYVQDFAAELSTNAQNALVNALANLPAPRAYDTDQLAYDRQRHDEFRAEPEGAELWTEWGDEAPLRYANMRARWNYVRDSLPEHERPIFDEIFCSMPPAAIVAAFRELAG